MDYMQTVQKILLSPYLSNIIEVENLLNRVDFFTSEADKSGAIIVCTEIFSNIVEHAEMTEGAQISIEIKKESCIKVVFSYSTRNFDRLLEAIENPSPYFERKLNRYRGLGLIMVKNLVQNIEYKKGEEKSYIYVSL